MEFLFIFLTHLVLRVTTAHGTRELVGYECGHQKAGYDVYSLVEIGNCDIPEIPDVETSLIRAGVLQRNDYTQTHAYSCRIEIYRRVEGCYNGWFSDHEKVKGKADMKYISELSRHACQGAHCNRAVTLFERHIIANLTPNSTRQTSLIFAGKITGDGKCTNADYSDPFGQFEDVVVQGHVHVTLRDFDVTV